MKRTAIAIFLTLACVLLTPLYVFAIGFDTDDLYNSVVVIFSGNAVGSGFAIGEHCIITNAHVIDDETSVLVTTYSGEKARAKVESLDSKIDIAVLSASSIDFAPLVSANIDECKVGDDVYTIGAPNAMAYTLTKGILSAKDRKVGGRSYLQTDAAINTGNSGGPLLTTDGKVIGVNTLKISDNEGIGLAIPITDVYSFLAGEEISVNNDGTVDEVFACEPPTETAPQNADTPQKQTETANLLLVVLLCCSVAINILFVVLWVYSKNKNRTREADPTERTDFEIDILE